MWLINKETNNVFDINDERLIEKCLSDERFEEIPDPTAKKPSTKSKKAGDK